METNVVYVSCHGHVDKYLTEVQALKITFDTFSGMSSPDLSDCTKADANLTLYDGPGDNAPIFATFCGDGNGPKVGTDLFSTPLRHVYCSSDASSRRNHHHDVVEGHASIQRHRWCILHQVGDEEAR